MISDPKTTPDGFAARAGFAVAAAALSYVFVYHFYRSDGFFLALALLCMIRPLIETLNPAPAYEWGDAPRPLSPPRPVAPAE